jgi:hypothetical protein
VRSAARYSLAVGGALAFSLSYWVNESNHPGATRHPSRGGELLKARAGHGLLAVARVYDQPGLLAVARVSPTGQGLLAWLGACGPPQHSRGPVVGAHGRAPLRCSGAFIKFGRVW